MYHVIHLLDDKTLARQMGAKGAEELSGFSVEKMLSDLEGFYDQALHKKSSK